MNINSVKGIVLAAMFTITFLLGLAPLKVMSAARTSLEPNRRRFMRHLVTLLNCFGGGAFLGACLLDLFPEVHEGLATISTTFPIAEFVTAMGLLLVFCTEQIVLAIQESHSTTNHIAEETSPLLSNSSHEHHPRTRPSSVRATVLLMALSLHSVFEGLALGLQTDIDELMQIFIAVIIHKSIIAFSLGLNLGQSALSRKAIVTMISVFSLTAPLGGVIGIGMDLTWSKSSNMGLIAAILQGIACGTFLYVTFFEVLPQEVNRPGKRPLKALAVLVGFAAITGAVFLDPKKDSSENVGSAFRDPKNSSQIIGS